MQHSIVKTFLHCVKKYPWLTLLLVISMAAAVILAVVPPLILADFIDDLTVNATFSFSMIILYFLSQAAAGGAEAGKEALIAVYGQKVTHALRSELSEKLNQLPAAHYVSTQSGETVSLFTNDIDTIENLFDNGVVSMIVDLCKVISIMTVILSKSTGLFCLMLALIPFLYFVTRLIQKKMYAANIDNRKAVARSTQLIPETIHNLISIRIFQKEQWMEEKYDSTILESFKAVNRANFCDAVYSPIILTTSAAAVAVMMSLSASSGEARLFFGMTAGTAVALISYISSVFSPLESIGMEIQNIQSAAAGISRVESFLNQPEAEKDIAPRTNEDPAIDIQDITFRYSANERTIFNHYSLQIQKGQMVTLTGRTGAGKSTLFKLVLGLYRPESGTIHIFGHDPLDYTEQERRKIYGSVEQDFRMIHGTIRQQITLDNDSITDDMVCRALDIAQLKQTVQTFPNGLDTPCSEQLFSKGQFQLLSIARAVVCDPKILLLDEITANLDSNTEKLVFTALSEASKNRTVLSISHRLYQAQGGTQIEIQ